MPLFPRRSLVVFATLATALLACLTPSVSFADDSDADTRFGMYIHASNDALLNETQMDAAVTKILDNGFNLVVPQVRAFGQVYYASDREPLSDRVSDELTDPLGALITKVKAKNSAAAVMPSLQLLTAYSYFDSMSDDASGALAANPGWVMVNAQGKVEDAGRQRYMDPTVPAVQDYLAEVVGELARKYEIAGVVIEDLMYPAPMAEWGFSPAAIEAYQAATGNTGRPSPEQPAWREWRAAQLTALTGKLRDALHEARPGARLVVNVNCDGQAPVSADDFENSGPFRNHGQDWAKWAVDGSADVVTMNNFRRDTTEAEESRLWAEFAAKLGGLAAIGMNVSGQLNFPTGVASQMSMAQRNGAAMITLYSLRQPTRGNESQLFTLLQNTVFATPRVFKRSGITFEPPVTPAPADAGTTPTTVIAVTPIEDAISTAPAVLEIPSPEVEIPMPVETAAPPAPDQTPAPATPTQQPDGFVLPPTPAPAVTAAPVVERQLPTERKSDVLYLKNGQVIRGRYIDEVEGKVIFEQESGMQLNIPLSQVDKIERSF